MNHQSVVYLLLFFSAEEEEHSVEVERKRAKKAVAAVEYISANKLNIKTTNLKTLKYY